MKDIKSFTLTELKDELAGMGEKPFRAVQIYRWLHGRLAEDFEQMTDLPEKLREHLAAEYELRGCRMIREQESASDGTKKYLFALCDDNLVESVLMRYRHGSSVCISSQVGCRMGCRFCASTLDGLERSLTASEMLEQIYAVSRITGERVSHVVVMGTGEPLDNYDNLVRFIRLLNSPEGLNISQRNITVSTCGIVPRILDLAKEDLAITLAISLHATTDEKRKRLMPIANSYSIEELMCACEAYFDATGRRITFEYSLVGGVNDRPEDAACLTGLARRVGAHVNLIPVNPIAERDYVQSSKQQVAAFKNKLEKSGVNVTIRREMGRDIDGACGQLRRRQLRASGQEPDGN